jgi:hypothetical protein
MNKWLTLFHRLLDHGADHLQHITSVERRFLAPLNLLCSMRQYQTAQYLLDRIGSRPRRDYTAALNLCLSELEITYMPLTLTLGSLRALLNEYMEGVVATKFRIPRCGSGEALISLVRRLLEKGANPNAPFHIRGNSASPTALHRAAYNGQTEVVKVLVSAGALLDLRAPRRNSMLQGHTALGYAMVPCSFSLAESDPREYLQNIITLLELGASFDDAFPDTWLHGLPGQETKPERWFRILFAHRSEWYNSDNYDLFERLMVLVVRQMRHQRLPPPVASDLMDIALQEGNPNEKLPQWYVTK